MTENEMPSEYNVEYVGSVEIKGKLYLYSSKIVFEPKDEFAERIVIPISRVRDAKFASNKDTGALWAWLAPLVVAPILKRLTRSEILVLDFEDELGIVQHLAFAGEDDLEDTVEELYEIRKTSKLEGKSESLQEKLQVPEMYLSKQALEQKFYWKCPRCFRQNAMKANICTRCGFEKPTKAKALNEMKQ